MNKNNLNELLNIKTNDSLFLRYEKDNLYDLVLSSEEFEDFKKLYVKHKNNFYMITDDKQSQFNIDVILMLKNIILVKVSNTIYID